jgi:hypothetical protein
MISKRKWNLNNLEALGARRLQALAFLVSWPAVERAARLVVTRAGELDGDHYEILSPAADALAAMHPLAATLVLRVMIDSRSPRPDQAVIGMPRGIFMECASLAAAIGDFGAFESHAAYAARLKAEHGRKSGFWRTMS